MLIDKLPQKIYFINITEDPSKYGLPTTNTDMPRDPGIIQKKKELLNIISQNNPEFNQHSNHFLIFFLNGQYEYIHTTDEMMGEHGKFQNGKHYGFQPPGEFIEDIILANQDRGPILNRNLFNTIIEFSNKPIYPEAREYLEKLAEVKMILYSQ